ncbi:MAG TPA: cupin domain-containing protein [Atopostipes sp.]|nr:cupin domain-containing protein [Atopostipes sp.]
MVRPIYLRENEPYPNNSLPALYYENVLDGALGEGYSSNDVLTLFENNGYTNGWKGSVKDRHHFHSNAHEALACTNGQIQIQLGGQNGEMLKLQKGDVLLLPAGTAHKRLNASAEHEIIGAYPLNDTDYDFQYGDASDYEAIKENISNVVIPHTDPVTGSPANIEEYWDTE